MPRLKGIKPGQNSLMEIRRPLREEKRETRLIVYC
jgi:hypothetical protein